MNNVIKCLWVLSLLFFVNTAVNAKYTKVANDGSGLSDSAVLGTANQDWACNYDNTSKLIWEVKNANVALRSPYASYTWYDSNSDTNGGDAGTSNGGRCSASGNCDTEKFVQSVNQIGLCGANDWRLPTLAELKTLINTQYQPALDPVYFPDLIMPTVTTTLAANIQTKGYWSSSYASLTNPLLVDSLTLTDLTLTPKSALTSTAISASTSTLITSPLITQTVTKPVTSTVVKPITSVITKPITDLVVLPVTPVIPVTPVTPVAPGKAWYLSFEAATSIYETKNIPHLIRLVRDAKNFIPPIDPPLVTIPPTDLGTTTKLPGETDNTPLVLTSEVWREEFNNLTDPGKAFGLTYQKTPLGQGAQFSRAAKSHVEYPFKVGLPTTGTLEFRLKIDSAYSNINSNLAVNNSCAVIFKTLAEGDYIFPGSAKFSACKNGDVSLSVETQYGGDGPAQILTAPKTAFRFGEWHVVSFSYGKNGQAISVDNKVVSEEPKYTQTIAAGGSAYNLQDAVPALGQTNPASPNNNDYDGFEGIIDTFRASKASKDWLLGKDFPKPTNLIAYGSFSKQNNTMALAVPILVNDVPQQQVFNSPKDELWLTFYTKPGVRYTITIPDDSVGKAIGPILALYDATGNLLRNGGAGVLGKGQQIQVIGTGQLFNIRVNNSPSSCPATSPVDFGSKRLYPKGGSCSGADIMTTSYKIQVSLMDNPQQGIVKGFVVTDCMHNAIAQADVSGLLNGTGNESTKSHNDGQFSLPLNSNTYQLQSQANSFVDKIVGPVNVGVENITQVQLEQTPVVGCANYHAPSIDPSIQEQQAVAVYDETQGLLKLRDVTASGIVFYVEFQNIGDFHFRLDRFMQLNNTIHNQPAVYDFNTRIADIPTVFAFNATWHVQLEHNGDWIFFIKNYAQLY